MSYTIHTIQLPNRPSPSNPLNLRCLMALQDADTFGESRDVLLRYYYARLRTWSPATNEDSDFQEYFLQLTNSTADAAYRFIKVLHEKNTDSEFPIKDLHDVIRDERKNKDATPYERVGHILDWLKTYKKEQQDKGIYSVWSHARLRVWLHGLLLDFTLQDAKKTTAPLLNNPNEVYAQAQIQWEKSTHCSWSSAWSLSGHVWKASYNDKPAWPYINSRREARYQMQSHMPPNLALLTSPQYGFTDPHARYTWRTAGDYTILHALLTTSESDFNKEMWTDWVTHHGTQWSKPEYAEQWRMLEEKGISAFTQYNQMAHNSDLSMLLQSVPDPSGSVLTAQSPTPINWYETFIELGNRYAYLNNDPQLMVMAQKLLSPEAWLKLKDINDHRLNQTIIDSLQERPQGCEDKPPIFLPEVFHFIIRTHYNPGATLALPDNLIDDQESKLNI